MHCSWKTEYRGRKENMAGYVHFIFKVDACYEKDPFEAIFKKSILICSELIFNLHLPLTIHSN